MKVVIIEDEQYTAEDLASCITELRSNYEVVKILPSINSAKIYFQQEDNFDLIFSDINLGDGLSFELFQSIKLKVPVIFCTAYDNYAIEAFKSNGIDYVLKPVNKKNILEAIEKFERLSSSSQKVNPAIEKMMEIFAAKTTQKTTRSVLVHVKDKIIPVKLENIAVFFIRNETTFILDLKGNAHPIDETLEEIELIGLPFLFRANRQFIINRGVVKDVTQHFARKSVLNLTVPFTEQIIVSKEKTPLLLKWLQNN